MLPPHFEKSGHAPVTHPILRIFIVENMSLVLAEVSNNCESKQVMYYRKEELYSETNICKSYVYHAYYSRDLAERDQEEEEENERH